MKNFGLKNWVWTFVGMVIVFCMFTLAYQASHWLLTDVEFHANRVYQMLDCVERGMPLWFYNNDYDGVGYGNSLFYGWLTLIPFMPVLKYFGLYAFIDLYRLVAYTVCFAGVCIFIKRFVRDNYMLLSCIVISQPLFWGYTFVASTYPNILGAGLCLIFFALCVDFFRDNKSFIPAGILFFVIFNTHMLSTIFAFAGCAVLCLVYFKKGRFAEYISFCTMCVVLCLWNITQLLYYFECYASNSSRISYALVQDGEEFGGFCFSVWSLFGILCMFFGSTVPVSGVACTMEAVWGILKRKKSVREIICLGIVTCIFVLSSEPVFVWLNKVTNYKTVIQFPARVFVFLIVVLAVIGLRYTKYNKLIVLLLCNMVIFGLVLSISMNYLDKTEEYTTFEFHGGTFLTPVSEVDFVGIWNYVGNGEYFPSNYGDYPHHPENDGAWDSNGVGYAGNYDFSTGIYSVDLSGNVSNTVSINRFWYKGYVSNAGECFQSDDGFVEVDVSDFKGVLEVWFDYPLVLRITFLVSYFFVGMLFVGFLYKILFRRAYLNCLHL